MSLFEKKNKMNVPASPSPDDMKNLLKENNRLAGKSNWVTGWALLATGGAIALGVLLGVKNTQYAALKARMEEREDKYKTIIDERETAKQEVEANKCYEPCEPWEMTKQIGQMEGEIATLKAEKSALQKEISDLEKQLSGKGSNISKLNAQIGELKKQIANLQKQISDKDAKIATLTQQVNNLVVVDFDTVQNGARVRDTIYIERKRTIYRDYGASYWSKQY